MLGFVSLYCANEKQIYDSTFEIAMTNLATM